MDSSRSTAPRLRFRGSARTARNSGRPPGSDNYNERMRQTINQVERVVRDTADLTITLEPRVTSSRGK